MELITIEAPLDVKVLLKFSKVGEAEIILLINDNKCCYYHDSLVPVDPEDTLWSACSNA